MSNQNTLNINELKYWVAFSKIPSIGPKKFESLLSYFKTMESAWKASILDLEKIGLDNTNIAEIIRARSEISPDREIEDLEKKSVKIITTKDIGYPCLLKEIYSPPPILFYRGKLPSENDFLIAVVGTRKNSPYGRQITESIVRSLSVKGLVIVSGLALGIDAIAHKATIDSGGKTIAILGSGIEKSNIYPMANRFVAEMIIEKEGCVISEHPPGTPPLKQHFPRRNRIISGISLGVLVIEAPKESGALLTAKNALDQNREVFAVPGNITSQNSEGTNNLIKMGARPVTDANDVLDALNLAQATEYLESREVVPETPEEEKILEHLSREPIHVDELKHLTNLPITVINSTLTLMEMKGSVRHLGSMKYVLAR